MSVLIVDDHEQDVELLRAILLNEGMHRVTTATDSRRVEAMLPSINPDLVLLDLHMPYVDGHAVLEQIINFAAGSYLPVLVLTADATTESRDRALSHGARDFLTKPMDMVEATLRIANLLETRELYSTLRRRDGSAAPPGRDLSVTRNRIERVLREEAITPVFQRIVDLDTMTTVGHEALARFAEPHERGPAGWFSDGFQVGLGTELEWLVVTNALPFLEIAEPGTFLALNMSPGTIMQIPQHDLGALGRCARIVIELTEHVPIEDYSALHRAMSDIRARGTRLAADDLGSGYAGFRHLVALEPDIVKLDISLVRGIHDNRAARALASAVTAFAADIGAVVIAEGVEAGPELAVLRDIGVRWAQGYLLGRPEPPPPVGQRVG